VNHLKGKNEKDEPFDMKLSFIDAYIKRDGRWLVWASQHTAQTITRKIDIVESLALGEVEWVHDAISREVVTADSEVHTRP
jgi:hypothetical protein